MKIKLLLSTFLLAFFITGPVYAAPFAVNFDADGTGSTYSSETIYGWDVEAIAKYSFGSIITGTLVSQDLGTDGILNNTDEFTETFTALLIDSTNIYGNVISSYLGFGSIVPAANLKLDVTLTGEIGGYSNGADGVDTTWANYSGILDDSYYTIVTGGGALLYTDNNGNNTYDAGDVLVAEFDFEKAADSFLSDSVWPGGAEYLANYSVEMTLLSYNADYWSDSGLYSESLADMVSDGKVSTYNEGSVYASAVAQDPTDGNTLLLGFDDRGIDVMFDAIPEPATMLLVGFGLLGFAGLSRKRS